MKKYFLYSLIFIIFSCSENSQKEKKSIVTINSDTIEVDTSEKKDFNQSTLDSLKLAINFIPEGDYNTIKNTIKKDRAYFKTLFQSNQKKAIDSCASYLQQTLLNQLVPHWYGTVWDFNGHTDIPNDGEIACGYFVSTTLKHLGFNVNRYKMAQQAGMNEALALQQKNKLKIYRNISFEALKTKLNKVYTNGIYFVGLSNHVGYVYLKDSKLYFLHSSYCDDKVVIEKAETSPCFQSDIYVFAEITTNRELIKKWIHNTRLVILK